jgi:hypothetical protein
MTEIHLPHAVLYILAVLQGLEEMTIQTATRVAWLENCTSERLKTAVPHFALFVAKIGTPSCSVVNSPQDINPVAYIGLSAGNKFTFRGTNQVN